MGSVWVLSILTHFMFMGVVPVTHYETLQERPFASLQECLAAGATMARSDRVGYAGVAWMPVRRRAILCEKQEEA